MSFLQDIANLLKALLITTAIVIWSAEVLAQSPVKPLYKNSSATTEARVHDLLDRMTLEENVSK